MTTEEDTEEETEVCTCDEDGVADHTCPYREDVNGDYDTLCHCCSYCQRQCCMDI
jgi:hypothetical protein